MLAFVQQVKVNNVTMLILFLIFEDCGSRYETYTRDCLGSRINLERLAQSIRQLNYRYKSKNDRWKGREREMNGFSIENCLSKFSNYTLHMSITTTGYRVDSIGSGLQCGMDESGHSRRDLFSSSSISDSKVKRVIEVRLEHLVHQPVHNQHRLEISSLLQRENIGRFNFLGKCSSISNITRSFRHIIYLSRSYLCPYRQ